MTARPAPAAPAGDGRLEGLDGLRGFAMLGVIFCHLNVFTIGWTGLPSFFVLSGFLITKILISDREQAEGLGGYFRRFYVRRVLRVFPIYYVYLLALTAVALLVPAMAHVRGELPAAYLYYYNLHMIFPHEHTRTLGHLWSLSVEEQFYIVWPWLIAFLPRRILPLVCVALVGLGPLLRWWAYAVLFPSWGLEGPRNLIYTYIFTLSHVDAFALGALVNFVRPGPRLWPLVAFLAAALAAGFAVNGLFGMRALSLGWPLFLPHGYQYTWGYTVVNGFWFLVICAILAGGPVRQFFRWPLLDYLGKRSYSTYILHFPLLALMEPAWLWLMQATGTLPGTFLFAVPYLAVVFGCSALTFRWIETPINGLKDRFRASRKLVRTGPAAAAAPGPGG